MPRKLLRRLLPNHETFREHKHLRHFGTLLHDPNLWHLNRRSVAGAVAVGLFMAWVPVPFQMVLAAAAAILFSVNLPISVVLVWITNPLTMPPMFFSAYWLGAKLLGEHARPIDFELSREWLTSAHMAAIWEPFLLGCLVLAVASALLGVVALRLFWRLHVIRNWRERRRRRRVAKDATKQTGQG